MKQCEECDGNGHVDGAVCLACNVPVYGAAEEATSILQDIHDFYDLEEPDDGRDCVNRIEKLLKR